jgi:hypothetical protein
MKNEQQNRIGALTNRGDKDWIPAMAAALINADSIEDRI